VRGSVYKRCQCRDANGKRVKSCRKQHGSWAFTIDAGTDPTTSKRKQIVRSGYRTRDEAEEEMNGLITAMNSGIWTDDKNITVADWLTQWLAETEKRALSPKTLASYRSHIRDVWIPNVGRHRVRDLRRAHIEAVIADLAEPVAGERPPGNVGHWVAHRAASTVDGYRRTIRAALAAALRRGLIAVNPATGRIDAMPARRHKALAIWETEETAQFLKHVEHDRLVALYELAAYAGLRRAELCGMRWSDIDRDGVGIQIQQTLITVNRRELKPEERVCPVCGAEHVSRLFKSPKTGRSWRWVPFAAPARAALDAHKVAQAAERELLGEDYDDHDLVFCEPDGTPLRPDAVTKAFAAHAAICGLPMIRLHDMRHGACSLLLAGGVPIEIVQMILGHSSPSVTRRIYAHVMKKITADQVERATELLTRHRREQSVSNTDGSADPDPGI
jgi:integrase